MADSNNIANITERLLDYLDFSDTWTDPRRQVNEGELHGIQSDFCRLPLRYFDEAEAFPINAKYLGRLTKSYERLFVPPSEIVPSDLPSWDVKYLCHSKEDLSSEIGEQPLYNAARYRKVPLREVRGLFRLKGGAVCEVSTLSILRHGKFCTNRFYVQYIGKGRWEKAGQPIGLENPEPLDEWDNTQVQLALSMAFTQFYDWKVVLGFHENLPKISLVTDPVGTKEIFRLRDIPNGGTRRAALRNWVREHYRQTRSDPPEEKLILEHLRGATEFTWNGMYCKIVPSQHDLQKSDRLRLLASV